MTKSIEQLMSELERSEDRSTYGVLADALVECGDPRGELMQAQLSLDDASSDTDPPHLPRAFAIRTREDEARLDREATLDRAAAIELRRHVATLCRERTSELLGPWAETAGITFEYRYGMLDKISCSRLPATAPDDEPSIVGLLARVFSSAEARLLRIVEISPRSRHGDNTLGTVMAELVTREIVPPRSLRSLVLGHIQPPLEYQFSTGEDPIDDLSGVLTAFPELQELWVALPRLDLSWTPLRSTHLRHLTYMTPAARAEELETLSRSEIPALESFLLWTGASHFVNERNDMSPDHVGTGVGRKALELVFAMLDRCPALRWFGIGNHPKEPSKLLSIVAEHAFASRIETLDLSFAQTINPTTLAAELGRFPALRHLVLEGVEVSNAARKQICGDRLAMSGGFSYGNEAYRYVVHQE